ncbi:MAG TPA: VWA domain-containing protein [Anaerolineae bacterium]|nr:VWA domain-containing protein [Anaerolineae bacterium]
MQFTTPLALLLLLAWPYIIWLGRPQSTSSRLWREWLSLTLRLLILTLLTLTLAGTQAVRAADELAVVFLVDASDSIPANERDRAETFIRNAITNMNPNDQAAVILFGADALVERPMSGLAELAPVTSIPQALHTDIGEAIRLGLALFPTGHARRLVILSDGQQTTGDAVAAARLAATNNVVIDYLPLTPTEAPAEALLLGVDAPTRVGDGERFTIRVRAESSVDMPAVLRVLADGAVITEANVQLRAGINNFPITLQATAQEFIRYRVQLTPAEDTYYQNNELSAFTEITGPPRILLVTSDGLLDDNGNPIPDESPQLRLALTATGLDVTTITPDLLSSNLADLSNYASIVMVNVNAKYLSPRKMEALQIYVRDLGGGLVVVGGPESYGMGGYFQTALEETLPVNMQIKDEERFPAVSIVIVIDRSGSMGASEGGLTKMQLANEGAARVVQLLNDFDEITVIPVDTQPDDVVGPVVAADKNAIIAQIRQIGAGGGGINVRTGMEAAAQALTNSNNQVQHVIVLADGADSNEKGGVPEIIDALTAQGATVSMVAIGDGPDIPWLQQMAARGNGRYHFTDRAANLPQIFTQETTSIQRSYLIEERFFPSAGPHYRTNPIMRNIAQVPSLDGYIGTSPKETAQIILKTDMDDPLLAAWQYGLGRSVAWTSDATSRWATPWVQWDGFPTFWTQVVRWTVPQTSESNVETTVTFTAENAQLIVDTRDGQGGYLNGLDMQVNVVAPNGQTENLTLQQIAPGRYEGNFTPNDEGAYFIRVAGNNPTSEEIAVGQTSGWVLGYSPEYQNLTPNHQLLARLAEMTTGRQLETDASSATFLHNLNPERTSRPIWPTFLFLAIILLPFDIAVRRLVITRRDLERAWSATFGRLRPTPAPAQPRPEPMSRLFQAKQRANLTSDSDDESPPPVPPSTPSPPTPPTPPSRPSPPAPPNKPATNSPLASRLLAKRRAAQQNDDND